MSNYILNYQIKANKVLLIDYDGNKLGVFFLKEAIAKAKEDGNDLVQVSANIEIPVCKIIDLGKLKFEESKKKKSQHTETLKEVRIGYNISDHDLQTKINHVVEFLKKNYKVNYVLKMKGCPKGQAFMAVEKFTKLLEPLADYASWTEPKQTFGSVHTVLVPKHKK